MFSRKCLLISLLLAMESVLVTTKGLNMLLNGYDEECLYLPKKKDEKLDYMVLSGGAKLDFAMYEPNDMVSNTQHYEINEHRQIGLLLNKTGDYKFCFANVYQNHPISVLFDYDIFDQPHDTTPSGDMEKEKEHFLKSQTDTIRDMFNQQGYHLKDDEHRRSFFKAVAEHKKEELYHGEGKGADDRLKGSMVMVAIYMDRMEDALVIHRKRLSRHHFLQMINHDRVMEYSILISLAMVVSTCIQLIVVKGFFNGKMSLNVFSYK